MMLWVRQRDDGERIEGCCVRDSRRSDQYVAVENAIQRVCGL